MREPKSRPDHVRESRWIVVTADGRHVTVGRHVDPTHDELLELGRQCDELGLAAWLAVARGDHCSHEEDLELLEVRRLGRAEGSWDEAKAAFLACRKTGDRAPRP